MASTFIVRDRTHPAFGQRVARLVAPRKWPAPTPVAQPADAAFVNRLVLTRSMPQRDRSYRA